MGLIAPLLSWAQNAPQPNVGLRIIVVGSADEARQILESLKKGVDFASLAKEKSTDATAADGGYMGRVDPATLRPELREALKGVGPGQLTGIIKLSPGFAIVKVLLPSESPDIKNASPARNLPTAATGIIRYAPNVGGKNEADLAFRSLPKPEGWSQDLPGLCEIRKKSLSTMIDRLENNELLDTKGQAPGSALDRIEEHYGLANLYAYQGAMDKAVAQWESAYRIATTQLPGAMPELEEVLGIAYLHKSEMENDVYRHPGDRCIFPPRPGVKYEKTSDSQKAIEYFLKYLDTKPDVLDVRWLLNLAYMTLGGYPAQVPQKYLIPLSAFESKESVPRFVDVAAAAGIDTFGESAGIIVDDFDNDGLLDVMLSDYDQCGSDAFLPQQWRRNFFRPHETGRPRRPTGRLQHDSGRLQQRWMPRCSDVARGLGVSAEEITAAEQLRRNIYRRDRPERPGRTGDQHASGCVGGH